MPVKAASKVQAPPTPASMVDNASETSTPRRSQDSRSVDAVSIDGRTRRKLKKSPASPKVTQPVEASGDEKEGRGLFGTRRRQSVKNPKVPQGARPMATTSSQMKQTPVNPPAPQSRSIPVNSKVPRSRQSSVSNYNHLGFSAKPDGVGKEKDLGQSASQFLPPVNFDDLHESITLGDFGDLDFSKPLELAPKKQPSMPNLPTGDGPTRKFSLEQFPKAPEAAKRHSRNNSFARPQATSLRQASNSSMKSSSMAPPVALQTQQQPRRQSYFYTSSSIHNPERQPRKSVGPGLFTSTSTEQMHGRVEPSGAEQIRQPKLRDVSGNKPLRLSLAPSTEQSLLAQGRNMKAKSMQSPPKLSADFLQADPSTPGSPWASSSVPKSPGKEINGPATPSSGRRMSMMPGHATGLGARTISPTDARRAKRLSSMTDAPPVPQTPPEPLPEPPRATTHTNTDSPILNPDKSVTPSSNRTTPDMNRKSYSSGISISSNTSFNSLKNNTNNARLQSQTTASSRLPTLKTRTENNSTGGEEGVPPVPAIPKAYDSPRDNPETPFFGQRKSSLPYDSLSMASASTLDYVSAMSTTSSDKDATKQDQTPRQRQPTLTNMELAEEERAAGIQDGRRTMQPLRLPLNLSTNDKSAGNMSYEYTSITPPPRKGPPKTPTTPMTASKSTFFTRNRKEETAPINISNRSNSSYHALRHESSSNFRAPSSSGSSVRPTGEIRPPRKATSPFISSSLPKSSGEFARPVLPGDRSASNVSNTARNSRLTGPRAQTATKTVKSEASQQQYSPSDTEATSFGNSIRRKLSLTRRRSSSKAEQPQPPAHESMPPPKLPASATLNNLQANPSPSQKHAFLHSRRKSSAPDAYSRPDPRRAEDTNINGVLMKDSKQLLEPRTRIASKTSESNIKRFNSNSSLGSTKLTTVDTTFDASDRIAEEEMAKLALKRKKTEMEARELDELRRRAVPRERVSPAQALRAARLNIYERGEIVDFKDVFFCGTSDAKKFAGNLESENANFGYDDDRGDYNIVLGDHLSYRYEVVDLLGKGSFGQVVRCVDHKTGGLVAIKIIRNKKRFHQQALVEVNILQKLREWDPHNKYSMVNFVQSFYFRGHLCISTELLGMNLYEFIKIHDFRGFSIKLIRRFTKQLLNSLVLLKSKRVIHCDLKPENILLTHPAHSEIKVIDFGSSCLENEKVYTYIQSRFYRSPEVILGMSYGLPIDMWSLGCILAELLTGYPIFPGENEQEQLACIMEVFGPPDKHLIEKSTRKKLFFDSLGKPRITVSSKGKRRRPSSKTLSQALKCDDEAFLDFLTRCLRWDPERRMKPDEAVHHEFITGIKAAPVTRALRSGGVPSSLHTSASTSPIKRYNSIHVPSSSGGARPLPEPPSVSSFGSTLLKGSTAKGSIGGPSPNKAAPKRHSTVTASTFSSSRKGPGPPPSGTLPKLQGTRVASGRTDLASAAAAAATTKQRT